MLVQLIVDMNERFNSCNRLWLCLYIHGLDSFRSHGLCSFEFHLLIVQGLGIGMTLLEEKIIQKLSQDIKQQIFYSTENGCLQSINTPLW